MVFPLSKIDLEKLRDAFAKSKREKTSVREIRDVVKIRLGYEYV